ncbi:MAG TPA: MoxR family ATPase [Ktedonobacterales bacterium]|nr:MoxR family ATPase [Ktedonobacterales bacterium]
MQTTMPLTAVRSFADAVRATVGRVIVGKENVTDLLLVALLSDGHVLLEDTPGMGKTVLAKSLARALDATFQRIQGTPDLLPGDVTGVSYFDQRRGDFVFRPGPIFGQIVLFDEINRTTPRTQSALLEAMAERQVTVDRETLPLPRPFLTLATQNPIELDGTFPLPEAQLDRFLLRVRVGYPSEAEELSILHRFKTDEPLADLKPVASADDVLAMQQAIRQARWQPDVEAYLLAIVRATRANPAVTIGASPRAALALYRAAEAHAAIQGRDYVEPDDVKLLAAPALAHRLLLTTRARLAGQTGDSVMAEILKATPTPVEALQAARSAQMPQAPQPAAPQFAPPSAPMGAPAPQPYPYPPMALGAQPYPYPYPVAPQGQPYPYPLAPNGQPYPAYPGAPTAPTGPAAPPATPPTTNAGPQGQ